MCGRHALAEYLGAVRAAGGHRAYVREPRVSLLLLLCACERGRAALDPAAELAHRERRVYEVLFGLGPGRLPLPVAAHVICYWWAG